MHQKMLLQTKRSTWLQLVAVFLAIATGAVAAIVSTAPAMASPDLQPKTTHAVEGRENCLMCHPVGSGGAKPSPDNHASYTNATCLGCHPTAAAAAEPTAEPAAEPTKETAPAEQPAQPAEPTATEAEPAASPEPQPAQPAPAPAAAGGPNPTTHPVEGRENCAMCHQVGGGVSPMPADHEGRGNDSCLMCHPAQATQGDPGAAPVAAAPMSCIDCHSNKDLSMELPSGEKLSLFVDEMEMGQSVHGGKLVCADCHADITGYPHPEVTAKDRREFSMALYEACKRCHFANYTKTLDSMHYQVLESGNREAPLCTDCHGYHSVSDPDQPRSKISKSCASCHEETYNTYAESVHGSALARDENNTDVPVCTDCHGSHVVEATDTAVFRLNSPEMCADCHADEALMAKYDISPNVFKTYMQDFHGATVALTKEEGGDVSTNKAVCSDCHGVHDIQSFTDGNPAEIRQKVLDGCQKCHPDAGTNFPDSWLGHYELSLQSTPLPWLVRAFYTLFIPFMIGGLVLHIGVDLWRIRKNR